MDKVIKADPRRMRPDGGSKQETLPVGTLVKVATEPNQYGYVRITVISTGRTGYFNHAYLVGVEDADPPTDPPTDPPAEGNLPFSLDVDGHKTFNGELEPDA